jgi:hypothetical protein
MEDKSYLDKKYFIDQYVYNYPFCNRRNVRYSIIDRSEFNWSENKKCFIFLAKCSSCSNISMHLSYEDLTFWVSTGYYRFKDDIGDIDSKIFYSVPTSFFVIDSRIPKIIRELITEAEGCLKMNFLTGASACMRKAIYELTITEKAEGQDYERKIKFLKSKYQSIDPKLFDILAAIKDMTSDKIHEQSWDKWDSDNLRLIIETLKIILYEIYVLPRIKEERLKAVQQLREKAKKKRSNVSKDKPLGSL